MEGTHMAAHRWARLVQAGALAFIFAAAAGGAAGAQGYDSQPRVIDAPPYQGAHSRYQAQHPQDTYTNREIIDTGHRFFGEITRNLADLVERATRQWGQPNAYILGEEGSGAFIGGLRYGEGTLYTRRGRGRHVFWQGPTVGFDIGGSGSRVMMLIYDLPAPRAIFNRFAGIHGAAYLVGGLGMTALENNGITVVPIQTGVGARLGVNMGYLKFTPQATWNPF
jgi:hypothetical protein